ncbi:MAG: nuclear transport factor 2 family protein [Myxococcota bacterium]
MPFPEQEIRDAYDRLVETRSRVERGELAWDALAAFFTVDATFIDPAWGRVEGIDEIKKFLVESMQGLEGWTFPRVFTAVHHDTLVSGWQNRLPGRREDGSYYEALGVSVMTYAGEGRFSREEDILNMVHVYELMKESGWKPGPGIKAPPSPVPR